MIKIGQQAPLFNAKAVINNRISDMSLGKIEALYKILFFYPLDFTFVCPTELHALQEKAALFQKKGVSIFGISVDSEYSHFAWLQKPKNEGGIAGVTFPLISDLTKSIARDYGVLNEEQGVAERATFILDAKNIIQHITIGMPSLGRNIEEIVRAIDALSLIEKEGETCPANWNLNKKSMKATHEGVKEYLQASEASP